MANERSRVIGPDGEILTLRNLPPPETKRWMPHRKAMLVSAVRGGLLSLGDVCARYGLTPEEFSGWQNAMERSGLRGLRITRPPMGHKKQRPPRPACSTLQKEQPQHIKADQHRG